jgi:hypothetical protein
MTGFASRGPTAAATTRAAIRGQTTFHAAIVSVVTEKIV